MTPLPPALSLTDPSDQAGAILRGESKGRTITEDEIRAFAAKPDPKEPK